MTLELTPRDAALFADAAYGVREGLSPLEAAASRGANALREAWDLGGARSFDARSGAVIRPTSGFGLLAEGRGAYAGHRAIALRGTQTKADWLSNANMSFDVQNGVPVHAGFRRLAMQVAEAAREALLGAPGPVHVIGHSLGGAMAAILTLALRDAGKRETHLYTFGAPRTAHVSHAEGAARLAGPARRVVNVADPVPMLPLWPFGHAHGIAVPIRVGAEGAGISVPAHGMETYRAEIGEADWTALARAGAEIDPRRGVAFWLGRAERHTRIPGGAVALRMIGKALNALLEFASVTVGSFALGAATTLDVLSSLLMTAARMASEAVGWLTRLVALCLRWLGRGAMAGANLTQTFLTYVLGLMLRPLTAIARSAVDRLSR